MPSRTRKFRGLRTHGRGIKAGRGAGKQGGRGNAGLHKYKFKSMLIYAPDHFGRHGFKRPPEIVDRPTTVENVGELVNLLPLLKAANAVKGGGGDDLRRPLAKVGIRPGSSGAERQERTWKVFVPRTRTKHAKEKVTMLDVSPIAA